MSWLRRLGLSLGLCLALLIVAEVLVRVLLETPRVNATQIADPVLGFRNAATRTGCWDERGTFEFVTNSLGFRGPELPSPGSKRASVERILLLGDSFLQAWMVRDERWIGSVLRDELRRTGREVEVYALNSNDFGTAQELLALREYGQRVQPDQVVLFLFPCNDLLNNTLELAGRSTVSANDYYRPYLVQDEMGRFERRYALPWRARFRRSNLFRVLEQRWLAGRDFDALSAELTGEPARDPSERVAAGLLPDEFHEIFRQPNERWDTAWLLTEALVLETRGEAGRLGARFTVVVIPGVLQVENMVATAWIEALLRRVGRERVQEVMDLDLPELRLEEFFHREGLAHVQLLGPLRRRVAENHSTVYLRNFHLSGDGHELMGRLLAARLGSDGRDTCYEAAGGPVDVLALLGDVPLELDFSRHEHSGLFGWGWQDWSPPFQERDLPGWGLDRRGLLMVRPSLVTLRGELTERAVLPLLFSIASPEDPRTALASKVLDSPGRFTFSFQFDPELKDRTWSPVFLKLEGSQPNPVGTSRAALVLQGLSIGPP